MVSIAHKRSIMTLYSEKNDIYCHQVRIVLAEKGIGVEINMIDPDNIPEDLQELNPYGAMPTLIDRELVLYEARIIMEYLDERFPHPPLLPVYPVARAKHRLLMHRVHNDWYTLMHKLREGDEAARVELQNSIIAMNPVFGSLPFFMSEEFTLVDCCVAPLLWRLPEYGIEIPAQHKGVHDYMARVFERASFVDSLTDEENEIRMQEEVIS